MASVFFFLMPIYMYVMENERIPLMPFYLPGIDETTISGYSVTMVYQSIIFLIGIPAFLAYEFLLEVMIMSSLIFGKLISLDTERINDDLKCGMICNATYRTRNILMMHQEMIE